MSKPKPRIIIDDTSDTSIDDGPSVERNGHSPSVERNRRVAGPPPPKNKKRKNKTKIKSLKVEKPNESNPSVENKEKEKKKTKSSSVEKPNESGNRNREAEESSNTTDQIGASPPVPPNDRWHFCANTAVVRFDVTNIRLGEVPIEDLKFLSSMFNRDDIALIVKGLAGDLSSEMLEWDAILKFIGQRRVLRVKMFRKVTLPTDKNPVNRFTEVEGGYLAFDGLEYNAYLEACACKKKFVLTKAMSGQPDREIDTCTISLYLYDFYLKELVPYLFTHFNQSFKVPEMLPGGIFCTSYQVSAGGFGAGDCSCLPANFCLLLPYSAFNVNTSLMPHPPFLFSGSCRSTSRR
jgi:hypothetical protein